MDKYFALTVPRGSVIHRGNVKQTLTGVPDNAQELWEGGSQSILLKKDGAELLQSYKKERLEEILALRKRLNYPAEIKLLESALKNSGKSKTEKTQEKEK